MFGNLKEKLKNAIKSLTGGAKEEAVVKEAEPQDIPQPKEKVVVKSSPVKAEPVAKESVEPVIKKAEPVAKESVEPVVKKAEPAKAQPERSVPKAKTEPPKPIVQEEPKKGFFSKVSEKFTTIQMSKEKFEELFWDLELALMENNVAVEVIEKVKADLNDELTTGRTARGNLEERILRRLEESLREILDQEPLDLLQSAKEHKPLIIAMVGVNGSGKTTTAAKIAYHFKEQGKTVVLAACDTFRAAAIQQLEEHAKRLGIPIIKQEYGADPAAVAFDAVKHAEAKGIDVVIIDTAGRLHSNTNLMDELKKVIRVSKPHHVLFVGESLTGNDCVEQAHTFSQSLPIDGIVLTKADVDEKGGAAVSVSYVTRQPVVFIGTGQGYQDIKPFDIEQVISSVLPS